MKKVVLGVLMCVCLTLPTIADSRAMSYESRMIEINRMLDKLLNDVRYIREVQEQEKIKIEEEKSNKFIANVSWYTSAADECGGKDDGITASGTIATEGRTIACDHLPFGTKVLINGNEYIVEDRFGGGYTDRIDIYTETKEQAFKNGRQYIEVTVLPT